MLSNTQKSILTGTCVFLGLYVMGLKSYPLFHTSVEMFAIVVAFSIFMLIWNTRTYVDNAYLLFLGIAYFFIGGIDMVHTLAYKGVNIFKRDPGNLAAQLWISARYVESLSMLTAPLLLGRKVNVRLVFATFALISLLLLASIFYWQFFPVCFTEEAGLTVFKKASEYVIIATLAAAIVLLAKKRSSFEPRVLRLLVGAIILTGASELSFTLYEDVYGPANKVGHFLKLASFYLVYKAIFQTGVVRPYADLTEQVKERRHLEEGILDISERVQRRIGQELHDSIGQLLAGIGLMVKVLEQKIAASLPGEASYARKVANLVDKTAEQTRRLAKGLSPMDLETGGLVSALQELATSTEDFGVCCSFECSNAPALNDVAVAKNVYRIAQEAIANAIKHGSAKSIHMELTYQEDKFKLTVSNDGTGFPEGQNEHGGMGLKTMDYRARLIDGSLEIGRGADGGAKVTCVFPNRLRGGGN
ncbi:MAG: hypothetical protein JSU94_14240 [Phycisphaerales bacterium]|nr:MAG: hypothetical protein JSU94_14240 [Phycisphaerales bacterium]